MIFSSTALSLSFAIFFINFGEDSVLYMNEDETPEMLRNNEVGHLALVTASQVGDVQLEAQVHESRPPIQSEWTNLVEFSFAAGMVTSISDLELDAESMIDLPLESHAPYRLRYVIINGQEGYEYSRTYAGGPALETYLVQIWPEPVSVPLVDLRSPWSQIWK